LRPIDIYDTNLTDKIFVKDSFWRIEKINEADLVNEKLTEVSLIKERGGYYKVEPPAPYYGVEPNAPYPSSFITSATTIISYTATTPNTVCLGSGGTASVLVFGTGFTANSLTYLDFGTSYGPTPLGTFLKQTGTTETFVVINNRGEIIPYDCG
jgi:hypothetical protein